MQRLPKSLMLPSRRIVHLSEKSPPRDVSRGQNLFAQEIHVMESKLTLKDEKGERVHVGALELRDFHTLRAILTKLEWIAEKDVEIACINCEENWKIKPCSTLELGPFVDREIQENEP